jgi:hypothetical protein
MNETTTNKGDAMPPDADGNQSDPPTTPEPPPPFDWNTAHDLIQKAPERALVLGLSMVSEQLDYLIQRMK